MLDMYNGAYCVLTASCAVVITMAFCTNEPSDIVATEPIGCSTQVYLYESIDHFKEHMLMAT